MSSVFTGICHISCLPPPTPTGSPLLQFSPAVIILVLKDTEPKASGKLQSTNTGNSYGSHTLLKLDKGLQQ